MRGNRGFKLLAQALWVCDKIKAGENDDELDILLTSNNPWIRDEALLRYIELLKVVHLKHIEYWETKL